jgi:lipoprotein-anchoring transpeptidase ErfK/SrfK
MAAVVWPWREGGRSETVTARQKRDSLARSDEAADKAQASTNHAVPPEGALVIPSIGVDGRAAEPRILVPISGSRNRAGTATNVFALTTGSVVSSAASLFSDRVLTAQVALIRRAISPGPIDAMLGPQTRAALRAFQEQERIPTSSKLDATTEAKLLLDGQLYTNYVVSAEDLDRLMPLGKTWLAKSEQPRLDYESILELVAEKSHANPKLVRWLNPGVDWTNLAAGTALKIVLAEFPPSRKAAFIRIFVGERKLQVLDADTNLLAHFPCSIAARVEKRPVGEELHISVVAPNPNYTFDPEVFPESEEAQQLARKLILQPGPNNPVGTVWLGLDKPGYGIHGTPKPEEVGRTESHGCFRLANWNAEYLLKLVAVGTPVFVEP